MVSLTHIVFCITSLILGPFIFLNTKGDRRHRWVGKLYCVSMLALNFSALAIYNLTGHFNFFHFTALLSLAMVLIGWAQVVFRRRLRNWLYRHYIYMCWSYVALIAAAFNEGFVRLAPLKALVRHTGNWAIIATQVLLLGAAALVINRRKPKLLARYADTAVAEPTV
jgi:uncharacterized membrane protein